MVLFHYYNSKKEKHQSTHMTLFQDLLYSYSTQGNMLTQCCGWEWGSVAEHWLSMLEALRSTLSTAKIKSWFINGKIIRHIDSWDREFRNRCLSARQFNRENIVFSTNGIIEHPYAGKWTSIHTSHSWLFGIQNDRTILEACLSISVKERSSNIIPI